MFQVPLRCPRDDDQLETALDSGPQVYCSLEDIDHSLSADDTPPGGERHPPGGERQPSGAPISIRARNTNSGHNGVHDGATTGSNNGHVVPSGPSSQPKTESSGRPSGVSGHTGGSLRTEQPSSGPAIAVPRANGRLLSFPQPTAVYAGSHSRGTGDGSTVHPQGGHPQGGNPQEGHPQGTNPQEGTGGVRPGAGHLRPSPSRSQGSSPSPPSSSAGQSWPLPAPTTTD